MPEGQPAIHTDAGGRVARGGMPAGRVWVLRAGWHTGLVLSRAAVGRTLTSLFPFSPTPRFLVLGWGNRDYYVEPHPGIWTALSALFPSPSVVLVQACRCRLTMCLGPSQQLRRVIVSRTGIVKLRRYLELTLEKNHAGRLEPVAQGPFPKSEFFASGLSYDAFHTCNTWTAEALRKAGLPMTVTGVLFAFQLWEQLPKPPSQQRRHPAPTPRPNRLQGMENTILGVTTKQFAGLKIEIPAV